MATHQGQVPDAAKAQPSDKPSVWLKLAYGLGAAAFGIKNNGFDYFLLLFYGTVIGLEPGLVGLAIMIALVFDAVSDPLVGYWPDNFHSRWGRRHPFMYAAALPVALSYFGLWNPPDWGQFGLFAYLTLLAILIRTLITFFETPSSALLPELTSDYEERTSLQSYRLLFGWSGGTMMSILMFGLILTGPEGMQDRAGYETYGIIASVLIFIAIMVTALGTHHRIPHLSKPSVRTVRLGPRRIFADMIATMRNRSFIALFAATIFASVATGIAASLNFLILNYFWGFDEFQIFIIVSLVLVAALVGFLIAPAATRLYGKKKATIVLGIVAFAIQPLPVLLRLVGAMPENGDPLLFPLVAAINTFDLALIIALSAVFYSMVADLVEANQLETGQRSEGVYYAAMTFSRKTTQGLGVLAAGTILSVIDFPEGAAPDTVSGDTLWWLGALYAPSLLLMWVLMLVAVSRYRIDKAGHEDNLRRLAASGPNPV